jgi:hypothetical protein
MFSKDEMVGSAPSATKTDNEEDMDYFLSTTPFERAYFVSKMGQSAECALNV